MGLIKCIIKYPPLYHMVYIHCPRISLYSACLSTLHPHLWQTWIILLFPHCCSVTQLYLTLCHFMKCRMPGFPVLHYLLEFVQTHVYWASDAIQPSYPLLPTVFSCPQSFPASGSFPEESALHSRWPKYWSFSFSTSPSNEYSGLTSFRIDWFDPLAVQGTLKSLF